MVHHNRLRSAWNRVDSGGNLRAQGGLHLAPPAWQGWLSDAGSLTKKIEVAFGRRLEVIVLADEVQTILPEESRLFKKSLQRCRVREVLLCIQGEPVVVARSVIPTSSSSGHNRLILKLGNKPLGAVLFANTHGRRSKTVRDVAHLSRRQALWRACQKKYTALPSQLWARRTIYYLNGHPLLVSELFLPSLLLIPLPTANLL
ncbi:chorismate lyase [Polynucleobacter sp. IMCC30063]|uniref:chorismate--pyruvate lyase family protein n=1 Tax=unclassified Polynucleobacter TaxID=2640945 RepID=UPI001F014296|nr:MULTISPECIES: chorismate lyase [unclassified Polynucleobacter]MCE7506801.1 chorismate lyase [Polynucleobacter sp. IMCC30063]MCE7528122.1 chorismate lyase [Polynucleobacter sp. IMCC 30228]MCE7529961.1 chorismate lyase [Polynucleobacter sp. IMCC 29146]